MIDTILFCLHYTLMLLSGIALSASFCGIPFTKKNALICIALFLVCGISQLTVLIFFGVQRVWEWYPVIVHLLLGVLLCVLFRKRSITVLASVSLAYLCCEPAKLFGLLSEFIFEDMTVVWCVRILVMGIVSLLIIRYAARYISEIFNADPRSVRIFSCVPLVYYLFDYTVSVYTNLQDNHYNLISELLVFFLFMVFMIFSVTYYREYEKKNLAQQKNQIIAITAAQQAKEIEAIRKSNLETSLLRHDMRLLLSTLALSIEQDDKENALNLISGYVEQVEAAALHRYCRNDTLNYVLTDFESKCKKAEVAFHVKLELEVLPVDEIKFCSILSNALDNALNAQAELPREKRQIHLMLKHSGGKLLLSVKNPFRGESPLKGVGKIPVSTRKGHGYGTQSILYMTEQLGGKCQFSVQDQTFILRVVL